MCLVIIVFHALIAWGAKEKISSPEETITHFTKTCKSTPKTTIILIESTIQSMGSNLGPFARLIDVDQYCDCYLSKMIKEIGFDHTARFKSFKPTPPLTADELFSFGQLSDQVTLSCVQDQKDQSTNGTPSTVASVANSNQKTATVDYENFMASPVQFGKGIDGISVSDNISVVFKRLGPAIPQASSSEAIYMYGPTSTEIEIRASSKAKTARVISIKVGSAFKGSTNKGIRIGSSQEDIIRAYGKPIFEGSDKYIYRNGTGFGFDSARKVNSMWVEDPHANSALKTRIEYCDKTKICK